jgi:hypothetical protein
VKVGAFDHPKMFHLAHLLDVERWAARGLVESILIITGKYAIRGDIGRMEDLAIALAVDWKGDAGRMIACLVGSRWLDEHPDHRLVVHNWHKHAPGWVKGRLKQDGLEFVGNGPSSSKSISSPIPIPIPIPGKRPLRSLSEASKRTTNLPDGLKTPLFETAWARWTEYRREIRHKLTPSTIKSQIKMLAKLGETTAIAAIEQSIANGWIGLFEPQESNHGQSSRPNIDAAEVRRAAQRAKEHPAGDRPPPRVDFTTTGSP